MKILLNLVGWAMFLAPFIVSIFIVLDEGEYKDETGKILWADIIPFFIMPVVLPLYGVIAYLLVKL